MLAGHAQVGGALNEPITVKVDVNVAGSEAKCFPPIQQDRSLGDRLELLPAAALRYTSTRASLFTAHRCRWSRCHRSSSSSSRLLFLLRPAFGSALQPSNPLD